MSVSFFRNSVPNLDTKKLMLTALAFLLLTEVAEAGGFGCGLCWTACILSSMSGTNVNCMDLCRPMCS